MDPGYGCLCAVGLQWSVDVRKNNYVGRNLFVISAYASIRYGRKFYFKLSTPSSKRKGPDIRMVAANFNVGDVKLSALDF